MDDNKDDTDDEEFFPHMHNFSALNSILSFTTPEELKARDEKKKIMEKIHKYDILFHGMAKLMYESYLKGKTLDEAYDDLKDWANFM